MRRDERWGPWLAALATMLGLLLFMLAVVYTFNQQKEVAEQNKARIAENARTAHALCDAAGGARDFWIKVRSSTVFLLRDTELTLTERRSNKFYIEALDEVIAAADDLAGSCS